jgi:hypothetical protein
MVADIRSDDLSDLLFHLTRLPLFTGELTVPLQLGRKKVDDVTPITLVIGQPRYLLTTIWGAAVMENFSKRTTAIIAGCLLLFAVGWGVGWEKVAQQSCQPVHCDFSSRPAVCTAKAA